jgi:hypothetical protein
MNLDGLRWASLEWFSCLGNKRVKLMEYSEFYRKRKTGRKGRKEGKRKKRERNHTTHSITVIQKKSHTAIITIITGVSSWF